MKKVISIITILILVVSSYAQTPIFYESFNDISGEGGNDGKWNGSLEETVAVLNGWSVTPTSKVFQAKQCIRIGHYGMNKIISLRTPSIKIHGAGVLIFKAAAWNTKAEKEYIKVSIGGADFTSNQIDEEGKIKLEKGKWNEYYIFFNVWKDIENINIKFETISPYSNRFFLDEVQVYSSFPISISPLGYSTLYSVPAYQLPDEITAYKIVKQEENIKLEALGTQQVPANSAVLVKGKTGTYTANLIMDGGVKITDNLLLGNVALEGETKKVTPKDPQNQIYVLNKGVNGVGFYWQTEGGGSANVGAWRCYLELNITGEQAVQGISLTEEYITATPLPKHAKGSLSVYDLAGRQVQQLGRGLYIVNGKKIIR